MSRFFNKLASFIANKAGSWQVFVLALMLILVWGITGPILHYSTNWQLIANTFTTLITFLMVILVQNEQNRNDEVLQKKLDYLVKALSKDSDEYEAIDELEI